MIMELIEGISLKELIEYKKEKNIVFSEKEIIEIMKGILKGLNYLHTQKIIHRDIKTGIIIIISNMNF